MRTALATLLIATQLFDVAVHAVTGQLELLRVAIAVSSVYVAMNGIFVASEGLTNASRGGEPRTLLFILVLSTTLAMVAILFAARERRTTSPRRAPWAAWHRDSMVR